MRLSTQFNRQIAKASVVVLFAVLSLLIPWQAHKSKVINEKLLALMHTFIAKDNPYLANAIFENRERAIRLRIEELLKISGIQNAAVFDRDGNILSSSAPNLGAAHLHRSFGRAEKEKWISWTDRDNLWYLQAINTFDETIGFVLVEYSLKDLKTKDSLSLLFYTLIFIALILTMLLLTNRLIRKIILIPVNRLILSMSRIEKGRYGEQIAPVSQDEIGELARRFNAMSKEISASYEQIEAQNRQLHKTKNLLDGIINSMPSMLITIDTQCRIKQWNAGAANKSGGNESIAAGRQIWDVFGFIAPLMPQLKTALTEKKSKKFSKILASENGEEKYFDLIVYPIISGSIDDAVVIIDDISTLVRMENIMVQTEKMMSVGGLAAGMAHEINNPLAGMIQNSQVVARRLIQDLPPNIKAAQSLGITMDVIREYVQKRRIDKSLEAMKDSGLRAAQIVESMLAFSRQSTAKISKNKLDDLLDSTITLLENDYNLKKRFDFKNIQIIRDYAANTPQVSCDGNLIQQVFFNILKNGAEAMAETMTKDTHMNKTPLFHLRTAPIRDKVQVEIEDNGPGMPEDVQKRIFEPFYTTKEVGVGTGLGLSVSYFIITENHGGKIWAESVPGEATKFIIQLPVTNS
ncbi:MAG TPA: hypothetical protein DHV36_02600 [Desulfobacteraceae bacterium]|nr:hypothetical protein [Desulfobacteraceae bacterium]